MAKKEEKTNVMRILDAAKTEYKSHCYLDSGAVSGTEVADALGEDYDSVFKTLVTVGKSGEHYVFAIPVDKELDLKKAAVAAGEKSISMVKGTFVPHRLHSRRMFTHRNEKVFQDIF